MCSGAVKNDHHIELQHLKAEQTMSTFSLAHSATRGPQAQKKPKKNLKCCDRRENEAQREGEKEEWTD